jgi:hypothetical protein
MPEPCRAEGRTEAARIAGAGPIVPTEECR